MEWDRGRGPGGDDRVGRVERDRGRGPGGDHKLMGPEVLKHRNQSLIPPQPGWKKYFGIYTTKKISNR